MEQEEGARVGSKSKRGKSLEFGARGRSKSKRR
jgi:hypothetical protein